MNEIAKILLTVFGVTSLCLDAFWPLGTHGTSLPGRWRKRIMVEQATVCRLASRSSTIDLEPGPIQILEEANSTGAAKTPTLNLPNMGELCLHACNC